jgi:hypothetical protein
MPILGIIASSRLTAAPSSYESIATVTVGSGGAASVTFSSIPATYTHLQIRGIWLHSTTNVAAQIRFNSDTGSNYSQHILRGNGSAVVASGQSGVSGPGVTIASNSGSGGVGASVIDILDYTNTNKYKIVKSFCGQNVNGDGNFRLYSGLWLNTTAISNINIIPNGGSFNEYTQFALYGIKGA